VKKVVTEREIIEFARSGGKIFPLAKGMLITPLAQDRIKSLGITVTTGEEAKSLRQNKKPDFSIIALGCDHTGFKVKQMIIKYLKEIGCTVNDTGTYNEEPANYPEFASKVARLVQKGEADVGILIDATGIPSAITANKYKGIRAATCYNEFSVRSAREHNDANILVVGAVTLGEGTIKGLVELFLNVEFLAGRHKTRLEIIEKIESEQFCNS
jgi:ribose 5-phosphate isomerase B